MRPRAESFASDYIEDAVIELDYVLKREGHDAAELHWAVEVLEKYFSVVRDTPPIAIARGRFYGLKETLREKVGCSLGSIPYLRREGVRSDIEFESFFNLCRQRRSVRWFLDEPVPRSLIENALLVALQAPSACNRQPFFFKIFEGPQDSGRVAKIAMGTAGYAHQIPALLVLIGDWSGFDDERDRHLPYIDGALAAMQFMLALETLGLSSCPINWPDVEVLERRMDRELGLAAHQRPIMLMAVGYPDPVGGVAYSAKKPISSILHTS